jgi:hypothetical protein
MNGCVKEIYAGDGFDRTKFETEIIPSNSPVILKSLVSDWPALQAANKSSQVLCEYLNRFDLGKENVVLIGPAEIEGRFFYNDAVTGFNYTRLSRTLSSTTNALIEMTQMESPPALAMQGVSIVENLPGFERENILTLVDTEVKPRLWVGNKTLTNTHYDTKQNIACAVAGRRKFTFFPPEQIHNLYIGPLLLTPAGTPMSMVDLRAPDFARYPKFQDALAASFTADLEPGDAIYIPSYWWHNVESLDKFSMLVNYWWGALDANSVSPYHSLLHSLMSIPALPVEQRKVWRNFFDHFVFRIEQDPCAHLPPEMEDIIGNMSAERMQHIKALLAQKLTE